MSIVEFKRPERKNYSKSKKGKENPIEQIYDYIDDIKAGKVQNNAGRTIKLHDGTRFYGYVICDINDAKKVISEIKRNHPYEEPGIDIIPLIDVENL